MDNKTKKGIITALFVGAIAFFAYKAFKKPNPTTQPNTGGTPSPPKDSGGSSLDYAGLAKKLYDAFNGCGTSNDVWRNVLTQLSNQSDWDNLSAAYGTKRLTCWATAWQNGDYDLAGSFNNELSSSELTQANTILKTKGIKTI